MKTCLTRMLALVFLLLPAMLRAEANPPIDSLRAGTQRFLEAEQWDSAEVWANRWFAAAYQQQDWHGHVIEAHIAMGIVYAHLGDYTLAINNLGQAHTNAVTSQNQIRVQEAFAELLDIAQHEQRDIISHRKNQQLMLLALTALTLICASFWLMYRQKSRLLTAIVQQNHEALKREESTEQRAQGLSDEKKRDLLTRLETLMKDPQVYCEHLLTKDRVAEQLETTRTYLSQVINEAYGKSFTQYINDLRINEAIRRLDDPTNQRALRLICQDLGFNSQTTFNTQFQSRTGMTPAQYRKKVQELNS